MRCSRWPGRCIHTASVCISTQFVTHLPHCMDPAVYGSLEDAGRDGVGAGLGPDWVFKMLTPRGAAYHKLTSLTWFQDMPNLETQPRVFFEATTHDSTLACGALAIGARLLAPFLPEKASAYFAGAQRAWAFLQANAKWPAGGGFQNPVDSNTGLGL